MENVKMSAWTPTKVARLKQLVLRHVANGGTVRDACEQFEFETNGIHKTKANQVKWVLAIRHTCRDEYKRSVELGQTAKRQKYGEQAVADEPAVEEDEVPTMDDELSDRLFSTVLEVVEGRRQLTASVNEFRAKLENSELLIHELEDARKLDQIRSDKKDKEIEMLHQQVSEIQTTANQLQEDYELLRSNTSNEYYRLQVQFKEAKMQYDSLNGEYRRFQASSRREIEHLENQLRESQSQYEQLMAQYQLALQDNTRLTKRITDFAQQISSMVPSEVSSRSAMAAIPIRPSVISIEKTVEEDDSVGSASI